MIGFTGESSDRLCRGDGASHGGRCLAAGRAKVKTAEHRLVVDGRVRRLVIAEPAVTPAVAQPVIIDLHGSGFDIAAHARITRSPAAAADGTVVVIPQGALRLHLPLRQEPGWAWAVPGTPLIGEPLPRADAPDDFAFLAAVIDLLANSRRVDLSRVHAMGFSGGARLASLLPHVMPGVFASIACVAGIRSPLVPAPTDVAVLAIHGLADGINPYAGGAGPRWDASVDAAVSDWARACGCAGSATQSASGNVTCRSWSRVGLHRVSLVTCQQAGHCWPGTDEPQHRAEFGRCDDLDATAMILDFFRGHPRPGAAAPS